MDLTMSRDIFQRGRLILLFEPCDCWLGWYWDKKARALYVCLLPCLPIRWRFGDW
jgi:hypothetical protein